MRFRELLTSSNRSGRPLGRLGRVGDFQELARWRRSGAPLNCAPRKNQNTGSDEASNEVAEPPTERDAKDSQQEIGYRSTYDTEHDIGEDAGPALHEHFSEPTSKAANDDCRDPADFSVVHIFSPFLLI